MVVGESDNVDNRLVSPHGHVDTFAGDEELSCSRENVGGVDK